MFDAKIPFAIRKSDGKIVSIDDVNRGLACDCQCPVCHADLVARKGDEKVHHFGHHRRSDDVCAYAAETSVRLMLLEALTATNLPSGIPFKAPPLVVRESLSDRDIREAGVITRESKVVNVFVHQQSCHPQILLTLQASDHPEQEPACLCLYLPPAGSVSDSDRIDELAVINPWPNRGVLRVHYGVLIAAIWDREKGVSATELILEALFEDRYGLDWIYHPAESGIRAKLVEELKAKIATQIEARRLREQQQREIRERQEREMKAAQARFEAVRAKRLEAQRARAEAWRIKNQAAIKQQQEEERQRREAVERARRQQQEQEAENERQRRYLERFGYCHICGSLLEMASSVQLCDNRSCIEQWEENEDRKEARQRGAQCHGWTVGDLEAEILAGGFQCEQPVDLHIAPVMRTSGGWIVLASDSLWFISESGPQQGAAVKNVIYAGGWRVGFCVPRNPELDRAFSEVS